MSVLSQRTWAPTNGAVLPLMVSVTFPVNMGWAKLVTSLKEAIKNNGMMNAYLKFMI
jgi:hypothetical protein